MIVLPTLNFFPLLTNRKHLATDVAGFIAPINATGHIALCTGKIPVIRICKPLVRFSSSEKTGTAFCEAHHVGISPQEDRGKTESKMGDVQGCK